MILIAWKFTLVPLLVSENVWTWREMFGTHVCNTNLNPFPPTQEEVPIQEDILTTDTVFPAMTHRQTASK